MKTPPATGSHMKNRTCKARRIRYVKRGCHFVVKKKTAEDTYGIIMKVENQCHYFLGDIITSVHRATLISGGREVLLVSTLLGGLSLFVPFVSREDVEFFQMLEMHMRSEAPPLAGRDHLSYRSFYIPVRAVVDGDLCEQFNTLPPEKKRMIAEELDRSVPEVQKKIEDMRVRSGF